jgi:peptidoglycan hydrolase-like protein with peptidoglycan-binding domain
MRKNIGFIYLFCVSFLLMQSAGCGKTRPLNQEPQRNPEAMNLDEADAILSNAAFSGNAEVAPPPAAAVKEDEVPLDTSLDFPDNKTVQKALKKLGLYQGALDGKIGKKTKKAIKEFQAGHHLTADGKVGPKTWGKIKKALEELGLSDQVDKTKDNNKT